MIPNMTDCGVLDVIGGPMFSGKSSALLRLLTIESEIEGTRVLYINSAKDTRSPEPFSTHNPLITDVLPPNITGIKVKNLSDVNIYDRYDVIGIDEAQFFPDLVAEVTKIVEEYHKHVIVAGLDGSFQRSKFGSILDLIPLSDSYTKLHSWCKNCSTPKNRVKAIFTHRLSCQGDVEQVGGKDTYIPVCRKCYVEMNS